MKFVNKSSIAKIGQYRPGEGNIFDKEIIKLSSNENPFGCSELAKKAYLDTANYLNRYPEGSSRDLREAIAQENNIDPDNITCANGSDEIFNLIIAAFTEEGSEVIYTEHGFLMYKFYALVNSAIPIAAKETNLRADINNILAQVTAKTKIVFIANPNNPTGSYLTNDELIQLRKKLPENILLVIDGAYAEYVSNNDYEDGFALVKDYQNVIATRTFSKIHGLASLRVGYCYANSEVIEVLNKVRGPFNVNLAAQMAAVAAIKDTSFSERSRLHNDRWLKKFSIEFANLGIEFIDSVGNFFLIKLSSSKREKYYSFLDKNKIKIRKVDAYGLSDYLRITVGSDIENEKLLKLTKEFWL
ncbi:MAG: histidinol-phosphate transaminase [Rickettsiales bacterium]|nr:histidinol-phosphate transaminase [Rickettsiales bacterium]